MSRSSIEMRIERCQLAIAEAERRSAEIEGLPDDTTPRLQQKNVQRVRIARQLQNLRQKLVDLERQAGDE